MKNKEILTKEWAEKSKEVLDDALKLIDKLMGK